MENIDKIKCVLIDFENNDKTLDETAKEILLLFSVSSSVCDCDKWHDRMEESNNNCSTCDKPIK